MDVGTSAIQKHALGFSTLNIRDCDHVVWTEDAKLRTNIRPINTNLEAHCTLMETLSYFCSLLKQVSDSSGTLYFFFPYMSIEISRILAQKSSVAIIGIPTFVSDAVAAPLPP